MSSEDIKECGKDASAPILKNDLYTEDEIDSYVGDNYSNDALVDGRLASKSLEEDRNESHQGMMIDTTLLFH